MGLEKIDAFGAWDTTTGSSNVTVGLIDSGISYHDDLNSNISSSIFCGTDPRIDDVPHGTMTAGTIGAVGNNSLGVSGVCWNVTIASLKACVGGGNEQPQLVIDAINEAKASGIKILNFSGGFYSDTLSWEQRNNLKSTIDSYSGLLIVGAGNDNANLDNFDLYPQVFDCDNMIVVGASDSNDNRCSYSNYSATKVDLFAPGQATTTYLNNGYTTSNGTSMSAPYVTGVAALILSKCPTLSTEKLKEFILNNVDSVTALNGKCVSGGRLNAKKAVEAAHTHTKPYCTYQNLGFSSGHMVTCTVCDFSEQQAHNWIAINSSSTSAVQYYRCFECGAKSNFMAIPNPYALGQEFATLIDNAEGEADGDFVIELTSHIAIARHDGAYYLWYECDETGLPTFSISEVIESKWGSALKNALLQMFGFSGNNYLLPQKE